MVYLRQTLQVSKIYTKDDSRLDGAFTLYYMSVNIGSFFSMILVPILGSKYGLKPMNFGKLAAVIAGILVVVAIIMVLTAPALCRMIDKEDDVTQSNMETRSI